MLIIFSLMAQVMVPHHHHEEDICFVSDLCDNQHEHEHEGECSHQHEHEDTDKSCCKVMNMPYVIPQSGKDEQYLNELDFRFVNLFLVHEHSIICDEEILQTNYDPPEIANYKNFVSLANVLRGPPSC